MARSGSAACIGTATRTWRVRTRNPGFGRACRGSIEGRGHTIRLLHLLRLTLGEFEQASRAVVDDVFAVEAHTMHTHEELFTRGVPPVDVLHLRVETFHALARLLCERLDLELLPERALDRDFHVRLADDRRAMTATV